MARLKLFLFGSPQVIWDSQPADISLRKGLALIIYSAATKKPHTRDALATLLWPESDQQTGRANLRRTLYRLNKSLGADVLTATADTIALNPDIDVWIDTDIFEGHVEQCLPNRSPIDQLHPACRTRLNEAADLYTDDFLAGFTLPDSPDFDEWQFFTTESLRQSFARVLEQLVHTHQERGEYEPAIDYARRRVALDPLHEMAHCQLMKLYAWSGQHAAAIRQYQECVRLMEEELGVPPSEETAELYDAIRSRRLDQPALPAATRALSVADDVSDSPAPIQPAHNLPPQLTPFVGRDVELTTLDRFVDNTAVRLVTIVGPGGIGKTRLALSVAEQQLSKPGAFPDGVYFASLAAVETAEQVVLVIAEALNFPFDSGGRLTRLPREQILDYLRAKHLFLVLDNVEHVLDDAADVVSDILHAAPQVKLLVTSRERLYLHAEHLLAIQGLEFPADDTTAIEDAEAFTAVQLFVQSARRVQHDFALTADNVADVVRVCRLVEGMPLGVELAAAWVDMLPVADIIAEIQESLDFLETDTQNVPARQRSIRAIFETTWNRLTSEERTTFAQLSVFRSGFTRDAASHVTGTSLRMLAKLADKSLIQYNKPRDRYQVHELLRQYGADQLAQDSAIEASVRDRHGSYYCAELHRLQHDIEGANKQTALAAIDVDYDNILAGWRWAVARGHVAYLDQAMASLEHFSYWRGRFHDAEAIYRHAVATLEALPADGDNVDYLLTLARLWARHANFGYLLGEWDAAKELYRRSVQALDQLDDAGVDVRADRAYVLMKLGDLARNPTEARDIFQQSLDLYQAVGHEWWTAGLLCHLGYVALAAGEHDDARIWFEKSLTKYSALKDRWQMGWVLDGLSNAAMYQNDLEEAKRLALESLTIHREIGLRDRIADSLITLSWIALAGGDSDEARRYRQEALSIWTNLGTSGAYHNSDGLDAQPFMPRWFSDVIDQRVAAVASTLPPELIAQALSNIEPPSAG